MICSELVYNLTKVMCSFGTLVAQGVCCCFSCCCQQLSDALKRWLGPQKVTKIFYLFLVAIFTIPTIVILFYLNDIHSFIQRFSWLSCPESSGGGQFGCVGPSAVYRMSLSILILFGLMMLIMFCRSRLAMVVNEGLFCFKYLLVVALFIAFLWVKDDTFSKYADASKYLSIGFMILQSIILIDLFYLAGIKLVNHYDEGQTSYACLLIFLTILFEVAAVVLNILGYVFFEGSDECGNSLWVNIATSVILVLLPAVQLFHFNKQNSLLTTALVSMYVAYMAFICQFSYGGGTTCDSNSQRMSVASLACDIIVSTGFFILTMYGSIMGGSGKVKITNNTDLHAALGVVPATDRSEQGEEKTNVVPVVYQKNEDEGEQANLLRYTQSWDWVKWHFYMCLASIYVGMLVTNWTSTSIVTGELIANNFGFLVRLLIGWLTALLYIWTLVAPKVCPSRDFTVV